MSRSRQSGSRNGAPADKAGARRPQGGEVGSEPTPRTHLTVGIGASAGGLEAYRAFFSEMPLDSGMSFILVQHLDPNYASSLVSIVAGYTAMPVEIATEGLEVRADHVYVIAPDAILTIKGGILHLASPAPPQARRTSINTFLASLAEDRGENAVGIILSGFGNDGGLGIAAIKEHGGLTLSQAESDHHAKSGMPRNAASGGFVDHIVSVEDMPALLLNYRDHRAIHDATKGSDGIRRDLPSYIPRICAVLHSRLGRDFSHYKAGTLMRRIQRRMHVLQAENVPAYIERLRMLPDEADILFRELLISVTRFFRDPGAFDALGTKIVAALCAEAGNANPIRVWVAGCATGEEAYSLAILFHESLERSGYRRPLQIFATDIDERAIDVARAGVYPASIAGDLTAERLARYFVKEDGGYRVARELREACLFSMHDVVKDPPFSRLDLVSCRNLLIYFDPQLQQRVLATFHYALRPGAHVFLGPSEGVTAQPRLFAPLDKRHRLYTRSGARPMLPSFVLSRAPDHRPPPKYASSLAADIDRRASRAMARYAPAFLVVDRQHDIVQFSGQTSRYLEPATGTASLNLFNLLQAGLHAAARAGLSQAAATGTRALHKAASFEKDERRSLVNLIVEPLPDMGDGGLYVVAFQETGQDLPAGGGAPALPDGDGKDSTVEALNQELLETKERLSSRHGRAAILHGRIAVDERRILVGKRGTPVRKRRIGNVEGGAPVAQRGAADDQCRAAAAQ